MSLPDVKRLPHPKEGWLRHSSRGFRLSILALTAVVLSAYVRWQIADLADWSIDESANLWLGSLILSGQRITVGLTSSLHVPNLAGAPLLAAPLALLPDLLTISRTLSLAHLAALTVLALTLWRRGGSLTAAIAVLLFFPGLLLASPSLWNQYLTIPFTAIIIPVLLLLADGGGGPVAQAGALVVFALCALALPAIHLAGFADLAVLLVLLLVIHVLHPRRVSMIVLLPGLAIAGTMAAAIYAPWLAWVAGLVGRRVFGVAVAVMVAATLAGTAALRRRVRPLVHRFDRSRHAPSLCVAALCFCIGASAILPFIGAQAGLRVLVSGKPVGWLLLASQIAMVLAFVPGVLRLRRDCRTRTTATALLRKHFPRCTDAVVLLSYAVLLCAARLALAPTLLLPGGRSDLLLPVVPALLCPLLLLRQPSDWTSAGRGGVQLSVACAAISFCWLGATGLSDIHQQRYPLFVPPSEMRAAVDWIAARHREHGGGTIDLGYDLDEGLEWVTTSRCRPGYSWYSIGRPYDWLLRRRHGVANSHEGLCPRRGGTVWQLGYRRAADGPPGMRVVQSFEHLEVRLGP
jgi:hypothetical protein